jgi:hypothetical protein
MKTKPMKSQPSRLLALVDRQKDLAESEEDLREQPRMRARRRTVPS